METKRSSSGVADLGEDLAGAEAGVDLAGVEAGEEAGAGAGKRMKAERGQMRSCTQKHVNTTPRVQHKR